MSLLVWRLVSLSAARNTVVLARADGPPRSQFNEFGWAVFKWLGADRQLKKFYQLYQIFVCLLKFDGFFFAGFTLQFLVLVDGSPTAEKIITIVAMPVTLVVLVAAGVAMRQEWRSAIYAWLVVLVAGMAYFLFKLVRIYQEGSRYETAKSELPLVAHAAYVPTHRRLTWRIPQKP